MSSLGVISYGIYLWHETWIYQILGPDHHRRFHDFNLEFWAFFLAVLGLSIISSSLSYFVVEKPALRLKNSIAWWRRAGRRERAGWRRPPGRCRRTRPRRAAAYARPRRRRRGRASSPVPRDAPTGPARPPRAGRRPPTPASWPTQVGGPVDVGQESVAALMEGHVPTPGHQEA